MADKTIREQILEIVDSISEKVPATTVRDLLPDDQRDSCSGMMTQMYKDGTLLRDRMTREEYKELSGNDGGRLPYQYWRNPDPSNKPPKKPTQKGWEARFEEAQSEIAELKAWKERALARYPDLAVRDIVLKARKLVASEMRAGGDNAGAKNVMDGLLDDKLVMRATVAALENA